MILDVLENANIYLALNSGFAKAFEFLRRSDIKELSAGRHDIDGDNVYAIVSKEPGRKKEDALLEVHQQYIDIQFILEGIDEMGWKSQSSCKDPSAEYDLEKDCQFLKMNQMPGYQLLQGLL